MGRMMYGRSMARGRATAQRAKYRRNRYRGGKYGGKGSKFPAPELKFVDVSTAAVPVPSTGVFKSTLVLIPQGDKQSEREGRKVSVVSVATHLHVFLDEGTSEAQHDHVIICLVLDRQTNGALPSATDYVVSATNDTTFRNLSNAGRFKTLWRKDYSLNHQGAGGDGTTNFLVKFSTDDMAFYKFKKPLIIQYNDSLTTGVVSTQESNGLFLYVQSRHGFGRVNMQTRVRFYG